MLTSPFNQNTWKERGGSREYRTISGYTRVRALETRRQTNHLRFSSGCSRMAAVKIGGGGGLEIRIKGGILLRSYMVIRGRGEKRRVGEVVASIVSSNSRFFPFSFLLTNSTVFKRILRDQRCITISWFLWKKNFVKNFPGVRIIFDRDKRRIFRYFPQ